jgi:hypothetical protein
MDQAEDLSTQPGAEHKTSTSKDTPPKNSSVASSDKNKNPESLIAQSEERTSSPRRKHSSQKQIEANRRNAQRSTGPRTTRGKKTASRNALKHGLLAREVVISGGDGHENEQEFRALHARTWRAYDPVGEVEEMLVERIVTCWWRLGRVHRAENGEIRRKLDVASRDYFLAKSARRNVQAYDTSLFFDTISSFSPDQPERCVKMQQLGHSFANGQLELKKDLASIKGLQALWKQAKSELAESGFVSKQLSSSLTSALGICNYLLVQIVKSFSGEVDECDDDSEKEELEEGAEDPREIRKRKIVEMIELIDAELENLEMLKEYADAALILETMAHRKICSLPAAEQADKLLRYETHLDRQLYRAMHELERLQRQRKGEAVPPPLTVRFN